MRYSENTDKEKELLVRPLTGAMRPDGSPLSLEEYEKCGGYQGLRKALSSLSPNGVLEEVKKANLRGRGGAGFPTGLKWASMAPIENCRRPRYLIANADEMEPGTFKDRILIEGNPHQLIEGIIISSFAAQADIAYIFLRWAYNVSEHILRKAVAEAEAKGYLGKDILTGSVGTITPSGILQVLPGSDLTLQFVPSNGYYIIHITVDGSPVSLDKFLYIYQYSGLPHHHRTIRYTK